MNWDLIQDQWQSDKDVAAPDSGTQVLSQVVEEHRHLHRQVKRRDALETAIALIVGVVFAVSAWFIGSRGLWVASLAAAFLALWCLYVPWKLQQQRKLLPEPQSSADVLSYLQAERKALQGQYGLLRNIFSWYLGPAALGVLALYAGLRGFSQATLNYTLAVIVLYGLIYWLNQWVATRQLAPAIQQIDQQINELTGEDSPGDNLLGEKT